MNIDTAIAQQLVNMTNQNTPEGSLNYSQDGFNTYTDTNGHTVKIPKFTATQTLSPDQQALYDINNQTQQNVAGIGRDQSARIAQLLGTPVDLSNDAVEGRLNELASQRLEPQFARDEEALRTRLTNQGIREGSDAWKAAMTQFDQSRNDARNQLLLSGHGQAVQDILAERNQPIDEITALMSGSQVAQPNYVGTPQAGVANTDYAGMVQQNYQNQMQAAQMKAQQNQALMGGLFGLAGAATKMINPITL